MYERFTRDARRVLVLAQEEVRALGHETTGTEHLLLALTGVDAWVGDLLVGLGITPARVRGELTQGFGSPDIVPLGPDARAALRSATVEADRLGRTTIGAEHLLLGLLDVGAVAAAVLHELGHTPDDIRRALLAVGPAGLEDEGWQGSLLPAPPPMSGLDALQDRQARAASMLEPGERSLDPVLREALDAVTAADEPPPAPLRAAVPRCNDCREPLADAVRHLRVPVDLEVTVDLVYCGRCGHTLTTRVVERG